MKVILGIGYSRQSAKSPEKLAGIGFRGFFALYGNRSIFAHAMANSSGKEYQEPIQI